MQASRRARCAPGCHSDRLILDARPANCWEEPCLRWVRHLGSPTQLFDFFLQPVEKLRTFASDVRDLYYVFLVSRERAMRNTFMPELSSTEVAAIGLDPSAIECSFPPRFVAAMATQCMGDQSGVEFAQGAHLAIAARASSLMEGDLLSYSAPPLRGRIAAGIVMDDYARLEVVPLSSPQPAIADPPRSEGAIRMKALAADL